MANPRPFFFTLTIYLVLVALSPGYLFFSLPSCATDPKHGPSPDAGHGSTGASPATFGASAKGRSSWHGYLVKASDQLAAAPQQANPAAAALLASKGCLTSLAMQKSPLGYHLLTEAYLMAGPSHFAEAEKASQGLAEADATIEMANSQELMALAGLCAGDLKAASWAITQYTDEHVKLGHFETHKISPGTIGQMEPKRLALIVRNVSAMGGSQGQARKVLLTGLIDFFNQRFGPVSELSQRFKAAHGSSGPKAEEEFALTLSACSDLLSAHGAAAQVKVTELLKKEPLEYSALILLDSVCFELGRREEGLKQLIQLEKTDKDKQVCLLARARVLEQMAQPEDAMAVLEALAKIDHSDPEVLLPLARLENRLNKPNAALEHLHQYMVKDPSSGAPYFLRSQIYVAKGQIQGAVSDLSEAMKKGYCLVKSARARGSCYKLLGQQKQAQDDMNMAESFMQWVR